MKKMYAFKKPIKWAYTLKGAFYSCFIKLNYKIITKYIN